MIVINRLAVGGEGGVDSTTDGFFTSITAGHTTSMILQSPPTQTLSPEITGQLFSNEKNNN